MSSTNNPSQARKKKDKDGAKRSVKLAGTGSPSSTPALAPSVNDGPTPSATQRSAPETTTTKPTAGAAILQDDPALNDLMQERTLFLVLSLVGQVVQVQLANGAIYEGVFHTALLEAEGKIVLRTVRFRAPPRPEKGQTAASVAAQFAQTKHSLIPRVVFPSKEIVQIIAIDATIFAEGSESRSQDADTFAVDTEISGNREMRERELVAWKPDSDIPDGLSLELDSRGPKWDQFEANRKKFGVATTYDEELYTTRIDRGSHGFRERLAAAERIANEMEKESQKTTGNVHIDEERMGVLTGDIDEEELYSSVIRPQPTTQMGRFGPISSRQQQQQQRDRDRDTFGDLVDSSPLTRGPPPPIQGRRILQGPRDRPQVRPVPEFMPAERPPPTSYAAAVGAKPSAVPQRRPQPISASSSQESVPESTAGKYIPPFKRGQATGQQPQQAPVISPTNAGVPPTAIPPQVRQDSQQRTMSPLRISLDSHGEPGTPPKVSTPTRLREEDAHGRVSPAEATQDYMRVRQQLIQEQFTTPSSPKHRTSVAEAQPSSPHSPLQKSFLVGDPSRLVSLSLDPAQPRVSPEVMREFVEFSMQERVKVERAKREKMTQDFKAFATNFTLGGPKKATPGAATAAPAAATTTVAAAPAAPAAAPTGTTTATTGVTMSQTQSIRKSSAWPQMSRAPLSSPLLDTPLSEISLMKKTQAAGGKAPAAPTPSTAPTAATTTGSQQQSTSPAKKPEEQQASAPAEASPVPPSPTIIGVLTGATTAVQPLPLEQPATPSPPQPAAPATKEEPAAPTAAGEKLSRPSNVMDISFGSFEKPVKPQEQQQQQPPKAPETPKAQPPVATVTVTSPAAPKEGEPKKEESDKLQLSLTTPEKPAPISTSSPIAPSPPSVASGVSPASSAASTPSMKKPLQLNPNAKAFIPSFVPTAPITSPAQPSSTSSSPVPPKGSAWQFTLNAKPEQSIVSLYIDGFEKSQGSLDPPNTVTPDWPWGYRSYTDELQSLPGPDMSPVPPPVLPPMMIGGPQMGMMGPGGAPPGVMPQPMMMGPPQPGQQGQPVFHMMPHGAPPAPGQPPMMLVGHRLQPPHFGFPPQFPPRPQGAFPPVSPGTPGSSSPGGMPMPPGQFPPPPGFAPHPGMPMGMGMPQPPFPLQSPPRGAGGPPPAGGPGSPLESPKHHQINQNFSPTNPRFQQPQFVPGPPPPGFMGPDGMVLMGPPHAAPGSHEGSQDGQPHAPHPMYPPMMHHPPGVIPPAMAPMNVGPSGHPEGVPPPGPGSPRHWTSPKMHPSHPPHGPAHHGHDGSHPHAPELASLEPKTPQEPRQPKKDGTPFRPTDKPLRRGSSQQSSQDHSQTSSPASESPMGPSPQGTPPPPGGRGRGSPVQTHPASGRGRRNPSHY